MADKSAVLFLLDDTGRTGSSAPLMMQPVLGVPLLQWLTHALRRAELRRFFLVCSPALQDAAAACFPSDVQLITASGENPADQLHVFLSTAEDEEQDILTITGPAVYLPLHCRAGAESGNACTVNRQELMDALDETAPIGHFLRQNGTALTEAEGFFSLSSPEDVLRVRGLLVRELLLDLVGSGVEIWDLANTYVTPGVAVGVGTILLPGTVLEGKTSVGYGCSIGPNTRIIDTEIGNHCVVEQSRVEASKLGNDLQVGPFANLRPGTVMENGSKAGAFVELKQTTLGRQAKVPHLSYLGDAAVGAETNVGCGTVTANFDRVNKHATIVEENVFLGCNTVLVAPVNVGRGAYVAAGSVITEDVPPQALAISRPKEQIKKEWALKNKRADSE